MPSSTADLLIATIAMRQPGYTNLAWQVNTLWPLLEKDVKYFDGGRSETEQVATTEDVADVTDIITGYEALGRINRNFLDEATWEYAMESTPVIISLLDERENANNKTKLVDLFESRTKLALQNASRAMELAVLSRPAAPLVFRELNTFDGTTDTTGFFEHVAPAAQVNTPGGLNRATIAGWRHELYDMAGAFGTNGENMIDQGIQNAMLNHVGGPGPMNWICSPAFQRNVKRLYRDQIRYTPAEALGDHGNVLLVTVNGSKLNISNNLPTVGANAVSAYVWSPGSIELKIDRPLNWTAQPKKVAPDQHVFAVDYVWRGQVKLVNPRSTFIVLNGNVW